MSDATKQPFSNNLKVKCICLFLFLLLLTGCTNSKPQTGIKIDQTASDKMSSQIGNLPTQSAPGTTVIGNETVSIDISNVTNGYYDIEYKGTNAKVKLQIIGPDQITYTYNINDKPVYLPVSSGSGSYGITVFENIADDQYSTAYKGEFEVHLDNEFYPFLFSNLFVNYADAKEVTSLASSLCQDASCDLEAVDHIYQYVISSISYDEEKAKTVAFNYIPDLNQVLQTKKGICFDYASLMAGMLRSQSIPTRLQIGYAGEAYHAWISIYIQDIGWIDNIIQFDGQKWSLMDPTFAANGGNASSIKEFIGDGSNYQTLYTY